MSPQSNRTIKISLNFYKVSPKSHTLLKINSPNNNLLIYLGSKKNPSRIRTSL